MQHVEVDVVKLETRQRIRQIGLDVVGRDAASILIVMSALAEDHDLVAQSSITHPLAKCSFRIAVAAVHVCRIVRGAAQRIDRVEQGKALLQMIRVDHHRTLNQARYRLGNAGDLTVLHVWLLVVGYGAVGQ